MKVFFTASYKAKPQYQKVYDFIISTIKGLGGEVYGLEVQKYEDLLDSKLIKGLSQEEIHYIYLQKGIDKSNAVIIEASKDAFQLGHEATLALNFNKPVLVFSNHKDYTIKIKHPKFYANQYASNQDIYNAIEHFLQEVKEKHSMQRFNTLITPEQRNYLEWRASFSKKTASDVIRGLIEEDISKHPDYFTDNRYFTTNTYKD